MEFSELKAFMDEKAYQYEHPDFIESDPIQIPHSYQLKEDIEIAGFLAATIAWGNRKSIIKNAKSMMDRMGNSPYDFIVNANEHHLDPLDGFVHRTFNAEDFKCFVLNLREIYSNHGGLEHQFSGTSSIQEQLSDFKALFFSKHYLQRTTKHLADPRKGSAAKRMNMFLRWMVRPNTKGVDLGIWKTIPTSKLSCPLDVHTANVSRKLGLVKRKQNDHKTLLELDHSLRMMDSNDPVKYDYALFGLGVFEKF